LQEYEQIISKTGSFNDKIKQLKVKIDLNNKEIKNLEKELSSLEKKLSEALNNYNKNKTFYEKELEKQKEIDINTTVMKDKEININNLKTEVNNLRQDFKNTQDEIKEYLRNKNSKIFIEIGVTNSAQIVSPSSLYDNILKKCKDLFLKEFNEFSNIYSKLYDINNRFPNLFTTESKEILFSKEKIDVIVVSYSYPESNKDGGVCQICDKYDNSIPLKPKKSGFIFLNPDNYENNTKKITFHQFQFERRGGLRNKVLIPKPIDIGHEVQLNEFYKIDDTKIDEAIEKNLEEIKQYDFKKDCPNLQFGTGQNLKNENEFFQMLDDYFKKAKDLEKIFNIICY